MHVYIGNATKQVLQFCYRVPERKGAIVQTVPILGQTRLSVDMDRPQIDALIEQWAKYGLVEITEADRIQGEFEGFLLSVGKPIPAEKLKRAAVKKDDVLGRRGEVLRREAALAMVNTIEAESGGRQARQYEISVSEIEPEQGFANPRDKHIAEGFRIVTDNPGPRPGRRGRRSA